MWISRIAAHFVFPKAFLHLKCHFVHLVMSLDTWCFYLLVVFEEVSELKNQWSRQCQNPQGYQANLERQHRSAQGYAKSKRFNWRCAWWDWEDGCRCWGKSIYASFIFVWCYPRIQEGNHFGISYVNFNKAWRAHWIHHGAGEKLEKLDNLARMTLMAKKTFCLSIRYAIHTEYQDNKEDIGWQKMMKDLADKMSSRQSSTDTNSGCIAI